MLTRCTTCNTWFRLGQNDIRAAHGDVRCGSCGARFNALATLHDKLPVDAFETIPETATPITAKSTPAAEPPEKAPTIEETAEPEEPPETAPTIAEPVEPEEPATPPEPAAPDVTLSRKPTDDRPPRSKPADFIARMRGSLSRVPAWAWWTAGSVVLFLALVSQIVIHEHAALRANPATRGAVEALYSAFGHPLPPRHDLDALVITDAEVAASSSKPGALSVTATLGNRADFAQGWPLLRVTLLNRFGGVVANGLYRAGDYLPQTKSADRDPLRAGAARTVRLRIADPGAKAVGFVIVPCLSGEHGPVCAERRSD